MKSGPFILSWILLWLKTAATNSLFYLLVKLFVCLTNWKAGPGHVGKRLTNCVLFSRWVLPLSRGDVTFQQEAWDETLSEDFVPPGWMAECLMQGWWPRHNYILTLAVTLTPSLYPMLRYSSSTTPSFWHETWQSYYYSHTVILWRLYLPHFSHSEQLSKKFSFVSPKLSNICKYNLHPPPSHLRWLVRQWKTTNILEVKWEVYW